jgi:HTH-type transcriptional regulator/antitoxin HigA
MITMERPRELVMNLQDISAHWMALHEALGIGEPITSEAGYERGLAFVEQVFDGGLAEGPLSGLLSVLADRIRAYEERVHPWDDRSTPASALAALMQQHGLKQGELPEGGGQSVVSEVLSGKRRLNARQVAGLARRFSVPAEVFLA